MPLSSPSKETEPEPLVFQKRLLPPHLTRSPEQVQESFDLPRSRVSLDDSRPHHRPLLGENKKPSLLSTAMVVSSSALPPRSASTTNLGILRRAEIDDGHSSSENGVKATTVDGSAARPRLHFVEPRKQAATSLVSTRPEPNFNIYNREQSKPPSSAEPIQPEPEPAPRKRSLVIQEHADVLERAAERAARNNLSTHALEQHSKTGALARSRQHSMSSAGEETASTTRSSWALRSSSHGSSIGTSPTVGSEETSDIQLTTKPVQEATVVSIFNNTTSATDRSDPPPATLSRKLTFIHPAPSRRRSPPRPRPLSPTSRSSDRDVASSSSSDKKAARAVSDQDAIAPKETGARHLAFASCPKPERSKLSPAHAMRKQKAKFSASPAPHKLAYPQRLRGIRGSDPIRSPAPHRVALVSTQMQDWDRVEQHVSSEGSGYSEDEEDDDTDQEEQDGTSGSGHSDIQSLTESLQQSEDDDALSLETGEGDMDSVAPQESTNSGAEHPSTTPNDAVQPSNERRASMPAFNQALTPTSQKSPPRTLQLPRSTQISPRSGPSSSSTRKLKLKDSFSHPMCFLPDAFEDSTPPTPTEPDSEGYEPPRTSLLQGWLSEGGGGGSAKSSRRTSWQHPQSPGMRGEQGLAVPITLPPFRRTRERTAQYGMMSDGEASRSLGGNAAFIRETAARSLNWNEERRSAGSPYSPTPQQIGSVPVEAKPTQPVIWRQHSRPTTALAAQRRASHSVETRRVNSAFTSPIGSYSQTGRIQSHTVNSPVQVGQRRVSTSYIRSQPSIATTWHDEVVIATSPPAADAAVCLRDQLAYSPQSGSTTPGWISDGLPSQTASRYWSERLSSLAQAMSDELLVVGNAVLRSGSNGNEVGKQEEQVGARRSKSVPLHSNPLNEDGTSPLPPEDARRSSISTKPITITPSPPHPPALTHFQHLDSSTRWSNSTSPSLPSHKS